MYDGRVGGKGVVFEQNFASYVLCARRLSNTSNQNILCNNFEVIFLESYDMVNRPYTIKNILAYIQIEVFIENLYLNSCVIIIIIKIVKNIFNNPLMQCCLNN